MASYYHHHKKGDGFIAEKHMKDNRVEYYDIVQLSNGRRMPYILHEKNLQRQMVRYQIGPYCFLESAMSYIISSVDYMVQAHISPIYLDEIGLLEINHQGFYHLLSKLLSKNIDLVLVVRESLLNAVLEVFSIHKYEIIG